MQSRRWYTIAAGSFADVPGDMTGDAAALASQGFAAVAASGSTANRPKGIAPGFLYVDTTLSAVVAFDGTNWRNVVTGATA
jgi:hypothetical protein